MKVKANWISLSKVNEFWFVLQNVAVFIRKVAKKDLQETMDEIAGDVVEISFNVHPNFAEADLKMYETRFDGVSGWEITPVESVRLSSLATREEVIGGESTPVLRNSQTGNSQS